MKALVNSYIEAKRLAWSDTTIRSERYRLASVTQALDGNPLTLWGHLSELKPYSRLTSWVRVCSFWDWLIARGYKKGINPYVSFKKENQRVFKGSYVRASANFSTREVLTKIQQIKCSESHSKARQLLQTGMRYTESFTLQDGIVVGKGGKRRRVFTDEIPGKVFTKSYSHFRRQLAEVGLKPHDLRKVFLTELVEKGANEFELCALAGWSNLNTASSYIRTDERRLKALCKKVNT